MFVAPAAAPAAAPANSPAASPAAAPAPTPRLLLGAWALLWAGLIVGVSFVATPARFAAPALTLPVALQVGVVTFALLQKVNWGMLLVAAVLVWLSGRRVDKAVWLILLVAELFIDSAVLPVLSARAALYFGTAPLPPPAWQHLAYGVIEIGRVLLLVLLAFLCLRPRPMAVTR